jgi:hypothetical protein
MPIEPATHAYSTTTYTSSTGTSRKGCEAGKRATSEQHLHIRYERATPVHTHDADTKIPSSKYAPTSNVANAKANWTGLVTWRGNLQVILSQQVQALSRRASSHPLSRSGSRILSQQGQALSRSSNPTCQSTPSNLNTRTHDTYRSTL